MKKEIKKKLILLLLQFFITGLLLVCVKDYYMTLGEAFINILLLSIFLVLSEIRDSLIKVAKLEDK